MASNKKKQSLHQRSIYSVLLHHARRCCVWRMVLLRLVVFEIGFHLSPYHHCACLCCAPALDLVLRSLDEYCYKHQDFIVFVSAGSYPSQDPGGERRGRRKKVSTKTISSPAEAKNAVTVGSHFNPELDDVVAGAPENAAHSIFVDGKSAK